MEGGEGRPRRGNTARLRRTTISGFLSACCQRSASCETTGWSRILTPHHTRRVSEVHAHVVAKRTPQLVENSRADCNSRLIRGNGRALFRFQGTESCRPTAIRMRANGTRCDPSDVDRLAVGNQVRPLMNEKHHGNRAKKSPSSPVHRRAFGAGAC